MLGPKHPAWTGSFLILNLLQDPELQLCALGIPHGSAWEEQGRARALGKPWDCPGMQRLLLPILTATGVSRERRDLPGIRPGPTAGITLGAGGSGASPGQFWGQRGCGEEGARGVLGHEKEPQEAPPAFPAPGCFPIPAPIPLGMGAEGCPACGMPPRPGVGMDPWLCTGSPQSPECP